MGLRTTHSITIHEEVIEILLSKTVNQQCQPDIETACVASKIEILPKNRRRCGYGKGQGREERREGEGTAKG